MSRKKKVAVYEVPVLIPHSSLAGAFTEVVHVTIQKMPECNTQKQADQPYRIAVVDGTMYAIKFYPGYGIGKQPNDLLGLEIYTPFLGLSHNRGELEKLDADAVVNPIQRFKISTTTTARVLKAVHLFGFLTRTQYQAADRERLTLSIKDRLAERADDAEDQLDYLLSNGLPLDRAKKLIDGLVKQQKARDALLRELALAVADSKDDALFVPGAGL